MTSLALVLWASLLASPVSLAAAEVPSQVPPPQVLDLKVIPSEITGWCHKGAAGAGVECWMEELLLLEVQGLDGLGDRDRDLGQAVAYLNGIPVPHLPITSGDSPNQIVVALRRTDQQDNREGWADVLGGSLSRQRPLHVSLRLGGGSVAHSQQSADAVLVVFRKGTTLALVVALAIVAFLTLYLARYTHLLRDLTSGGPSTGTYSLARTQMAVWSVTAVVAFLFIWAVTGRIDSVTPSVLILIGIGGGTALAASVVDQNKLSSSRSEVAQAEKRLGEIAAALAPTPAPANAAELKAEQASLNAALEKSRSALKPSASEGFLRDLLSDGNGICLHRYQMLLWTVVLWFVFWAGVYHRLAMPEFNPTLLGLMGISAGTYLGFKIPE